ncbi:MAG: DUF3783 domain-containing protein [Selenomonadaceae bacterium]|nr:DUF3783 domain-containing protein [Selenomonadaceae bacterium]
MNREELVLLYGFDGEAAEKIVATLKTVRVKTKILKADEYGEKVGFLLGLKGFAKAMESETERPEEKIMVLQNIKGKRLDAVLDALRKNDCEVPVYKATVTAFNVHWTLKRLFETMKKEHGYFKERAD